MKIVKVTCRSTDQNGLPVARARITATLVRTEIDAGFVAPRPTAAVADDDGVAVLSLWPNALGVAGSTYKVVGINPATGREFINALISVPNSDCNLHEILIQAPFPPVSASERALVAAQGALALVTAQAGIATAKAALTAADAAATAADKTQTALDKLSTQEMLTNLVTVFNGRRGAVLPSLGDYGSDLISIPSTLSKLGTTLTEAIAHIAGNTESLSNRISTVETMADPLAYYLLSKG
jgi:hypothetical protein